MGSGGTRTDPESVKAARELAASYGEHALRSPSDAVDWPHTVLQQLVRLVQSHGGRVVFFEPPESTPFRRAYATPQDVKDVAHDVLRHRIILTYEAEAEEVTSEDIITRILGHLPVP